MKIVNWFKSLFSSNEVAEVIPMIYTSKGNLPIASLKYEVHWEIAEDHYYKLVERYMDESGEVVRESAHVYQVKGLFGAGETGSF
jgi:hypothetical protein